MKPGKEVIKLNSSLNNKLFNEYELLNKRLNGSLDESLQIDLKEFLSKGLVFDSIEHLFKDRNYLNDNNYNFEVKFSLMALRYSFVEQFGFVLLSEQLLNQVSEFLENKTVCEIGAGTGWLSYNLQKKGIDITPVDYKPIQDSDFAFKKLHTDILVANGIDYLENTLSDVVILSWPDYDTSFASQVLKSLKKGQTLIYIGEGDGGCTGDDEFFSLIETKTKLNKNVTESLQKSSLSWTGIHDTWYVFEVQ